MQEVLAFAPAEPMPPNVQWEDLRKWRKEHPHLSDQELQFLWTGMVPEEWEAMMRGEERSVWRHTAAIGQPSKTVKFPLRRANVSYRSREQLSDKEVAALTAAAAGGGRHGAR